MEIIDLPPEVLVIIFGELSLRELLLLKQLNKDYYDLVSGNDLFFRDYVNAIDPCFRPYCNPESNLRVLTGLSRARDNWGLEMPLYNIYSLEELVIEELINLRYIGYLVNLTKLIINRLPYVAESVFIRDLPSLKTIVFEEIIPVRFINDIRFSRNVKRIVVRNNSEEFDDREARMREIYGLENIRELVIQGTRGNCPISQSISGMKNLKKLTMIKLETLSLPCSLGKLCLRELRIERCRLERIPACLFDVHTLEELRVIDTPLFELPEKISGLIALRVLKIEGTFIGEIPEDIGSLSRLESLGLANNDIRWIPGSVGSLSNLRSLNLSGNQKILDLPCMIGLNNLECLIIEHMGALELLIDELSSLPKLEAIHVERGSAMINIKEACKINKSIRVKFS